MFKKNFSLSSWSDLFQKTRDHLIDPPEVHLYCEAISQHSRLQYRSYPHLVHMRDICILVRESFLTGENPIMGNIMPIDVTPLLDEEVRTLLDQGLINEEKPFHLLVYGTLLDRNRRRAFLGRDDLTHPIRVVLPGFRRTTLAIDGDKFPNLVHNSTSNIYNAEVVQVFIPELLFLNRYETDAYTLRMVQPKYYSEPFTFAYFGRETWREWEESQSPRRRAAI